MVIHAFFKRTLFLRRGRLISQMGGGQDSRFYGGFGRSSVSYVYFLIRCLSLAGFPFVVGFYSKDSVISYFSGWVGGLGFFLFLVGCVLTVGYSFRLIYSGFYKRLVTFPQVFFLESSYFSFPVFFLFFTCVYGGGVAGWFFLSDSSIFFRGVDLFWGIVLIFLGALCYFMVRVSFYLLGFFGSISFLRWLRGGGVSFFFREMFFFRGEYS
jgi:NADH-quinone oxidoreductase subunit L